MVTSRKTPDNSFSQQIVEKRHFIAGTNHVDIDENIDIQWDRRIVVLLVCAFVLFCLAAGMTLPAIGGSAGRAESAAAQLVWNGKFLATAKISAPPDLNELPPALTPFFFLPIPVNLADAPLLETINGIGPHLAAKIIEERRARGIFRNREDLLRVSGLGPKRIKQIENQLSFTGKE